ncbi:hypothetical protein KKF84_04100 [Myxococcota bacterium]|nr:hypothetical protein [Myxococcota bacterium]MBU1534477.1 hypothetical protein [Myxococcota bacterium]
MKFSPYLILPYLFITLGCTGQPTKTPATEGTNAPSTKPSSKPASTATSKPALPATAPKRTCLISKWEEEKLGTAKIKQQVTRELLGTLRLDMTADAIVALMGQPETKSTPREEAATGYILSEWKWTKKGVSASLDSSGKTTKVTFLSVSAPFTGTTTCGIGIGSTVEAMKKIYDKYFDRDFTKEGNYVVGSIYGGLAFTSKDNRINQISMGAFAE